MPFVENWGARVYWDGQGQGAAGFPLWESGLILISNGVRNPSVRRIMVLPVMPPLPLRGDIAGDGEK